MAAGLIKSATPSGISDVSVAIISSMSRRRITSSTPFSRRNVMLPPGHLLLVECPTPFDASLWDDDSVISAARALPTVGGTWFVLLPPQRVPTRTRDLRLQMRVHTNQGTTRTNCPILLLSRGDRARAATRFTRDQVTRDDLYVLLTNQTGAMSQIRGCWGDIRSQYDALFSANLDPVVPVDRRTLLTRCRIWVRHYDYSCEVDHRYLELLQAAPDGSTATWHFRVPVGMGLWVPLQINVRLLPGVNRLLLAITRPESHAAGDALQAEAPVRLIIRPDIEDRDNHAKTKAFEGAESQFTAAIQPHANGFSFSPYDHTLHVDADNATFHTAPEWNYMLPHPVEQQRGLGDCSDLFSPGYFEAELCGGDALQLTAATDTAVKREPAIFKRVTVFHVVEYQLRRRIDGYAVDPHVIHDVILRKYGRTIGLSRPVAANGEVKQQVKIDIERRRERSGRRIPVVLCGE